MWKYIEGATKSDIIDELNKIEKTHNILDYSFAIDRFRIAILLRIEEKRLEESINELNGESTVNIES
jgi:hypothetical protein